MTKRDAALKALDSISKDARRSRMGDRIPGEERHGLLISIGLADPHAEDEEDEEDGEG